MTHISKLSDAKLGSFTFYASSHKKEDCGINGLPLTLNSICIIGKFQKLKALSNKNLCIYIDAICCKHERIFIVFEHYQNNLYKKISEGNFQRSEIIPVSYGILNAIYYLHLQDIFNISLSPHNILFDQKNDVKLSFFGFNYLASNGLYVSFPIGCPKYLSPEILKLKFNLSCNFVSQPPTYKADVWAFGLILLEILLEKFFWSSNTIENIFFKILNFQNCDKHPLDILIEENKEHYSFEKMLNFKDMVYMCLNLKPSKRPTVKHLLLNSIFSKIKLFTNYEDIPIKLNNSISSRKSEFMKFNKFFNISFEEIFFFWQLGYDILLFYLKHDKISIYPSIFTIMSYIFNDGKLLCENISLLFDDTIVFLSIDPIIQKIISINQMTYFSITKYRSIFTYENKHNKQLELPLLIKEKNINYQIQRTILLGRLINSHPFTRHMIFKESHFDIPPFCRALIWSFLLDKHMNISNSYNYIDKTSYCISDRQIDVDIPRCHQYNNLISSPVGHSKLKRILKAWIFANSDYVYWQGLDSLAAPFIYINFNNEALAFECFSSFINKYLHNVFIKDNSFIIKQYLIVFTNIIAFHDPTLYNHMNTIGFNPELYAISWFLTMFAHIFPINKIFHLWDTLLLGDSWFPFCIGVAILKQLRFKILNLDFNDCILLFSEIPEIDIERCVFDSKKIFNTTPKGSFFERPFIMLVGKQKSKLQHELSISNHCFSSLNEETINNMKKDINTDKCIKICIKDLIEIIKSNKGKMNIENFKSLVCFVDIRPENEYNKGSIRESLNAPAYLLNNSFNNNIAKRVLTFLNFYNKAVKVFFGSNQNETFEIAISFIKLGYSKICVLDDRINIMKVDGLF